MDDKSGVEVSFDEIVGKLTKIQKYASEYLINSRELINLENYSELDERITLAVLLGPILLFCRSKGCVPKFFAARLINELLKVTEAADINELYELSKSQFPNDHDAVEEFYKKFGEPKTRSC